MTAKNNIRTFVLLGAAVVAGAVLTLLNLNVREKGDRGFDQIVEKATGKVICEEARWLDTDLPITFAIDPTLSEMQQRAIVHAAQRANQLLDRDLFVVILAPLNHLPRERVVYVETFNSSTHGRTEIETGRVSCRFIHGVMRIPGLLLSEPYLEAAVLHEIGHVLGLAHDDLEESIMWPQIEQWSTSSTLLPTDIARVLDAWKTDRP